MASCAMKPVAIAVSQNARRPNHLGFSILMGCTSCFDRSCCVVLCSGHASSVVEFGLGVLRLDPGVVGRLVARSRLALASSDDLSLAAIYPSPSHFPKKGGGGQNRLLAAGVIYGGGRGFWGGLL